MKTRNDKDESLLFHGQVHITLQFTMTAACKRIVNINASNALSMKRRFVDTVGLKPNLHCFTWKEHGGWTLLSFLFHTRMNKEIVKEYIYPRMKQSKFGSSQTQEAIIVLKYIFWLFVC